MMKRHENKKFLSLFSVVIALVVSTLAFIPALQAAGDGSWTSPYSVSQSISNQNNSAKTVQGYVVGQPTATTTVVTSNYPNDYALALADSPTETNTANMVYVQIPTSYRSQFGLKTNPTLKGQSIKVTGSLAAYFSHAGLKALL